MMHTIPARISSVLLCALTAVVVPNAGRADTFSATYLAAGVQTPAGNTSFNSFDNGTFNSVLGTTTFNGLGNVGTYSGNYSVVAADQYGGAGGTGKYITTSSSYSLSLLTPVNYFGLWFSALDAGNQLSFYSGNTLLYTYTPTLYQSLVGACPNSSNAFCGNPTSAFKGADSGEQFAYLNFYDTTGTFNKIVFTQTGTGNFESDNQAVALLTSQSNQAGTQIVTPEPPSLLLTLSGLCAIGAGSLMYRRRQTRGY